MFQLNAGCIKRTNNTCKYGKVLCKCDLVRISAVVYNRIGCLCQSGVSLINRGKSQLHGPMGWEMPKYISECVFTPLWTVFHDISASCWMEVRVHVGLRHCSKSAVLTNQEISDEMRFKPTIIGFVHSYGTRRCAANRGALEDTGRPCSKLIWSSR